jgi:aminoglycoside/choline kinase family phosphotransferase
LEHLGEAEFKPGWKGEARDVDAAVEAAASIHSAWYAQADALRAHPWVAPEIAPAQARAMARLWRSLAEHASPWFASWAGPACTALQRRFTDGIEGWWGEIAAMPRTLIHNDFNSRNIAFRRNTAAPRACAFDWELARIGVPQHDLAELLCFTFPRDAGRADLERWLELHRAQLAANARAPIDPQAWRRGFALALRQLLVERLPLYTLVHRFKVQPFLPGVVRNWARLYDLTLSLETKRALVA